MILVQELKRKGLSPRCVMKVDLRKAYDSVSWAYVEELLFGLQFPPRFTRWIMACITNTKYSLSINGGIHGYFSGKKGLRQGDPISPLIFVLCMEYLSHIVKYVGNLPLFSYHPRCSGFGITHLCFL